MHNQPKLEESILKFWKESGIYAKAKEASSQGKPYYFCDGPPYATGQIHPGTAWNKCIKDAICRYKRATGYSVRSQPGYDTHGLPIEVKVEQELQLKNKREIEKIGIEKFVNRCREYATQYIGVINSQFERCGVWMDWDNPYITYKNSYIEAAWKTIATAHRKGLLHEGVYVVPYCWRCETTLANYELEYDEQADPSIYVKFKLEGSENEYLIIWTTTPWTLISNMAIMVHPIYTYVKARVGDEVWIVAKERLDTLLSLTGESASVLGEVSGKKLEKLKYAHPLQDKIGKQYPRRVVLSDEYVTLEDGSGLVHCAPGHGPEDFIIGRRFDIEVFSPLDNTGKFTKEAGSYAGLHVLEASKKVISDLQSCGALLFEGKVQHRYPHCWRCKSPLVFMATNQWFISISKVKEKMLEEIERCEWQPPFAKTRFREFVQSAPDWCISRQRYWGIPLPIWKCKKCANISVVESASQLGQGVADLHRPWIDAVHLKCEKCGSQMQRVSDVLDVWFDSGNAVWAQLSDEEKAKFPRADFIVEGKDQTRGWFYSLLGSGVVLNDEIPYKVCLMHGFFVDEKGEKMSKSVGNFVPLEEVVDKYGADTFRLWALSNTVWDDLRFNWGEISEAHRALGTIYNLGIFLSRFYLEPKKPAMPSQNELSAEDRWLLSRLSATAAECESAFEKYCPHLAAKAVRDFFVEDISRFYMKIVKQRIDEEGSSSPAMAVLYHVIFDGLKLLLPIAPFISESIYQSFFKKYEGKESISLFSFPKPDKKAHDALLEKRFEIARQIATAAASARQKAKIPLRWPVEEIRIISDSTEVLSAVEHLSGLIGFLSNSKSVKIGKQPKVEISISINRAKVGEAFKKSSPAAIAAIEKAEKEKIAAWLSGEEKELVVEGGFAIQRGMVELHEKAEGFEVSYFDGGKVFLKTQIKKELYEEAMVREVARRVQIMRKEKRLVESDRIALYIESQDSELLGILKHHTGELSRQVNAESVDFSSHRSKHYKEWEIEEAKVKIAIEKIGR
ncbi:MAG: isoleucine--tRNA ligase [Candidatus Micrarchaeota archaeon]|nr:isoleucine--tRNA ligase [Candidatus Micrarchaeota archaeon]